MNSLRLFILSIFFVLVFQGVSLSQCGQWVWVNGDSTTNSKGRFGVQGVSDPNNEPPAVYEAFEFSGHDGIFWLFGGFGNSGCYSALWRYSSLSNEWTWVNGDSTTNDLGNYGIQGVPSATNMPPARAYGGCSWVDIDGNFWLFGGGSTWAYSDLWKYDVISKQWTWMKGPNTYNQLGIYGIQGVPDTANNPDSRSESSAAWTDNNGNLWLFGGTAIYDTVENDYNDLWCYNIHTNNWTWMKGSKFFNQPGIYGVRKMEDSLNTPGARWVYSRWKDSTGNFWLLGGQGSSSEYNDLWRYNPVTNNWAWISGDSVTFSGGVHYPICVTNSILEPGDVFENRAAWTDKQGNFWTFRDNYGCSLWMYSPSTDLWTLYSEDTLEHIYGAFGEKGVPECNNLPPILEGALGWSDSTDNFYLFGGAIVGPGEYNAMWKYLKNASCNKLQTGELFIDDVFGFSISPNPSPGNFVITFGTQIQNTSVEIYDVLGSKMFTTKVSDDIVNYDFSMHLSRGIYFILVIENGRSSTQKLVIQ